MVWPSPVSEDGEVAMEPYGLVEKDEESDSSPQHPLLPISERNELFRNIENENFEISQTLQRHFEGFCGGIGHKITRAVGAALVPSFLWPSTNPRPVLHPTSWLDGLRGVASFFVYIHHFILVWFPALSHGYGSAPDNHYFFQFPFIRIIYSGRGMVTLFFVISGYVLSYSALKKVRSREFDKVLDSLASSVFRRFIRLFLPLIASTMMCLIFLRLGWWDSALAENAVILPLRLPTLMSQLWDWWRNFILLSNPFMSIEGESVYADPYGGQLWTIPREFRGSLVIYITLLGLAKTGQAFRISSVVVFSLYSLWITQWDIYLFLSGMALAEIQFVAIEFGQTDISSPLSKYVPSYIKRHKNAILHIVTLSAALLAVHLLTFPDLSVETSPGYGYMLASTPVQFGSVNLTQRFWLCIGAVMLAFAIAFSPGTASNTTPILQRPFNTAFASYLANISYSIYVVHYHILFTVGYKILIYARGKTLTEYVIGFLVAVVVNTIITFWVSDLFWRGVDAKSVTFAKWIARKCFIREVGEAKAKI